VSAKQLGAGTPRAEGFFVLEGGVLRIGQPAPDFEVPLHTGEMFRLHEQGGKHHVILYFYPKDFTYGCTKEACSFSQLSEQIRKLNAVTIGIIRLAARHELFISKHGRETIEILQLLKKASL